MKFILFLASLLMLQLALAQETEVENPTSVTRQNDCEAEKLLAYNPISGTVPLAYGHIPATDLVCDSNDCGEGIKKGDILTSEQADAYYKRRHLETRCQWSLADLEPVIDHESSHIFQGGDVSKFSSVDLNDDEELELQDMDQVEFVSEAWARLGNYRVTVSKDNFWGMPTQYSIYLSKTVHNYLLRKALLRKLGYKIPPVKYVKRLKVNFPDKRAKSNFIKNISINNAGSFDRWILSEDGLSIVVQDVVVMEDQEFNYNLAKGYLSEDVFQGKRIYDSLLLPFALVDTPESINLMEWTIGRRYSDNIALKFKHAKLYNCSRDDATWMARRILKLSEKDWQDIVDATHLPPSVKLLLFEKLKSRRNHLGFLFNVENINLKVDSRISNHDDLEEGRITKEFYDGYARRFAIPDPESPLSYTEMSAFFKSKSITTGIELLVSALNNSKYMGTDLSSKITDFNQQLADEVATNITTGETGKLPVRTFVFPTLRGNLILNREIIAGSYLGTDNLIQLVDTVGASISVGAFGGITGVYTKTGEMVATAIGMARQFVPVDLNANANLFLNRTYAHVKPITSVQKALKYPFKNMFVPYLKRDYGHIMDSLIDEFYKNLSEEQKIQQNEIVYKSLKDTFAQIEYLYNDKENADFKELLKDDFTSLKLKLEEVKENYINKTDNSGLALVDDLSRSIIGLYQRSQIILKDVVESRDICLLVKVEATEDENGEQTITDEKCLEDNFDPSQITPEIISSHFPKMSEFMNMVDALNDHNNYHGLQLEGKEEDRELEAVMEMLNENLEVKESIIVTDTIGGSLTLGAGVSLYQVAKVRLNTTANKAVISRLHIHRASEDEIHVYKDLGNINSISISTSVEKFVPIMKFTFKGSRGRGRTKFHKIPIGATLPDLQPNIKRVDYLKALRSVLLKNSTQMLERIENPWVVTHRFKEKNKKLGIFVWRWNWLDQTDHINVTSPQGFEKGLFRMNKGKTSGRDFENYVRDLVDVVIGELTDTNYTIKSFNEGNPGYTYMGRAKNKIVSYEGVKNEVTGLVDKPYVKLSRIYNGWKMDHDDAIELLRDLKDRYTFRFVEEDVLAQTKELFLYNISVNFFVYDKGIETMLALPDERVKYIFWHYQQRRRVFYTEDEAEKRSGYRPFLSYRRKYQQAMEEGDLEEMGKWAMKAVEVVEENLHMAGIGQIFGGGGNVFAIARIDGFRVGDPNGDKALMSNSFGRVGTESLDGPVQRIKDFIGMTTGEFYMSWLLGRVI
jgi:mannose/fructose-specific phosphotransferase system component IIA